MAASVISRWLFGVVLAASLVTGAAGAASSPPAALPDPTRPPEAGAVSASAVPSNILQAIRLSAGRREATIGGRIVKLGDRIGDAKVTRITENEVHLRRGGDVEILKLYPEVEKKFPPAGARDDRASTTKR